MSAAAATGVRRVRLRVEGTVQGVGFRPHVYRLASELGLSGFVCNDARGVLVEAEGPAAAVAALLERIAREAPPLAIVERVEVAEAPPTGTAGFAIAASIGAGDAGAPVTADAATCEHCLRELLDPADRRHRYPFINCTGCGPRFTIVRGVPYDRPLTTMACFRMCPRCRAEYDDPRDRRFHAQPNACPRCGPSLALLDAGGGQLDTGGARDAAAAAARLLLAGAIVAVKGVGGYHLACRADDEGAVARLRARKHREDKPFALMAADLDGASALIEIGAHERDLLCSPARPIVVARAARRARAAVASAVAPGLPELGVMLPYSPLHHLLLADAGTALVLTSGNVSDEPIAYRDDDALARLGAVADAFLAHDRPIETRTDDSVVRAIEPGPRPRVLMLRRSRGYVPASLPLPGAGTPLLACGAELKHTFCVAKHGRAWVSHHIGDLENAETLRSLHEGVAHFRRLFDVEPEIVVHDLHPDYLSTSFALEQDGVRRLAVQHHHAHLAACLAEHGRPGPAVAAIYDGTGYGLDGTIWGGELLVGGIASAERAGRLRRVPMPGGAAAIREPWRMACAWLAAATGERRPALPRSLEPFVDRRRWDLVAELATRAELAPATSSAGRLFDAVAALCGLRAEVRYEGQAAIELEAAAAAVGGAAVGYELGVGGGGEGDEIVIDPGPALREIAADVAAGEAVGIVAARFHAGFAGATTAALLALAARRGIGTAVLSGGVFQNRLLLHACCAALEGAGMEVLVPRLLPAGDGGISYGQAAVAAASR